MLKEIRYSNRVLTSLLFVLCLCFSFSSFAENKNDAIDKTLISIDSALQVGDDVILVQQVDKLYSYDTILPDVSAFYLGYALYRFDEYQASKTALLRYVDLTQEDGLYFDSVVHILNIVDLKLNSYGHDNCGICTELGPLEEQDTCNQCLGNGVHTHDCGKCDGTGNSVCPRCKGTGFVSDQTQFYVNYVTCRTCLGKGSITCTNCAGTKIEKVACQKCFGDGFTPKERVCAHRDFSIEPNNHKEGKKDSSFYR